MDTTARIVGVLRVLEVLNLHEEVQELVKASHLVDINLKKGFQGLATLRVLVHSSIVDRISPAFSVLLRQDLSVPSDDITSILLE